MSKANVDAATAADEALKEGKIAIGAVTNKSKILCIQPKSDHNEQIIQLAMSECASKLSPEKANLWIWNDNKDQMMYGRAGRDGLQYWVFATGENKLRPYTCLELVQEAFEGKVKGSVSIMPYQVDFEPTLKSKMDRPITAKDEAYEQRFKEVTALALDSIALVLDRQKKIEYNEQLSMDLVSSSQRMKDSSHTVYKKYCCENVKCWIGIAVIIALIILVLVIAICVGVKDAC